MQDIKSQNFSRDPGYSFIQQVCVKWWKHARQYPALSTWDTGTFSKYSPTIALKPFGSYWVLSGSKQGMKFHLHIPAGHLPIPPCSPTTLASFGSLKMPHSLMPQGPCMCCSLYSEFPSLLNCQTHIQPSELCFRAMTSVRPAATTLPFVISLVACPHQDWIPHTALFYGRMFFSPIWPWALFLQCPIHGLVTKCSVNVCWVVIKDS